MERVLEWSEEPSVETIFDLNDVVFDCWDLLRIEGKAFESRNKRTI